MKSISVIVPCYNEQESIPLFYSEISKTIDNMDYANFEIIFVDDGCGDNSLKLIKEIAEVDCRVKYISLSRNFGKEAAIYAGLQHAKGDYVVLIDADLQHDPSLIKIMYETLENDEDYDCVATRRIDRKGEPLIRSFFSKKFYRIMNRICHINLVEGAQDYRMMKRQFVDSILSIKEYNRFSKGIFSWIGFKTKWIECPNTQRVAGTTKWSFLKLFNYSIEGIVAFSTTPLKVSSVLGILMCLLSFAIICTVIIKTLIWGEPVAGFPTLICAIFFVGGVQLFFFGVLGQYLARTYLETKDRPIYVKRESNIELHK